MAGLAAVIEEAHPLPGFAFVNVQSPCVTFGEEDQQLKAHKPSMKTLASLGHDPTDRAAGDGARAGVRPRALHRRLLPQPDCRRRPTRRWCASGSGASRRRRVPRERILDMFAQAVGRERRDDAWRPRASTSRSCRCRTRSTSRSSSRRRREERYEEFARPDGDAPHARGGRGSSASWRDNEAKHRARARRAARAALRDAPRRGDPRRCSSTSRRPTTTRRARS